MIVRESGYDGQKDYEYTDWVLRQCRGNKCCGNMGELETLRDSIEETQKVVAALATLLSPEAVVKALSAGAFDIDKADLVEEPPKVVTCRQCSVHMNQVGETLQYKCLKCGSITWEGGTK